MPTKIRNFLRANWSWGRTLSQSGFPKFLSPLEITQSSWATHIKSYADVPDVYKNFFNHFLSDEDAFPYTLMTPSFENFIHKTTEKLISDFGHHIYVLEKKGDSFEAQCYPIDEISYIELRSALLAASFKICGMTNQGVHTSSTLLFNSISDYLFTPILKKLRISPVDNKHAVQSAECTKLDRLVDINFKFMNLAKHSLLEEEEVIQFIIQPEIQESFLTFMGKTYFRTIAPTHLSILTDRELIVIREDIRRQKENRYGGIWDYIPLNKIKSLSVFEKNGDLVGLFIQLPEETGLELLFQVSAKGELNQLLERFQDIVSN